MAGLEEYIVMNTTGLMEQIQKQIPLMDPPQTLDMMKKVKEFGNSKFKEKEYVEAIQMYQQAMNLCQMNIVGKPSITAALSREVTLVMCQLSTNMSICLYELGRYRESLDAAYVASQADPTFWKACYRGALANDKLGNPIETMMAVRHGLDKADNLSLQIRCKMILLALKAGMKCTKEDMDTRKRWIINWPEVIRLVTDAKQWRYLFDELSFEREYRVIERIITVDRPENMGKCAQGVVLSDLVELAEKGEKWCDQLAFALQMPYGADPATLTRNGESPMFSALRLGLVSGQFVTLQHFFRILVDPNVKDMVNPAGENLARVVEYASVDFDTKLMAFAVLQKFGVGEKSAWETTRQDAKSKSVKVLQQELDKHCSANQLNEAVAVLEELLSRPVKNKKDLYLKRCKIYLEQKNYNEAMNDAKKVIEYDGCCLEAHRILSQIYDVKAMSEKFIKQQKFLYMLTKDETEKDEILYRLSCYMTDTYIDGDTGDLLLYQCEPDVHAWSRLILRLFKEKQWLSLLKILTRQDQGELAKYRAVDIPLFELFVPKVESKPNIIPGVDYAMIQSLALLFLERGADITKLFTNAPSLVKKPVTGIFIACLHLGPALLDYLIERGDLDKEPNYPDINCVIHQYLRYYRRLPHHRRHIMLCRLRNELKMVEIGTQKAAPWQRCQNELTNPASPKCKFLKEEAQRLKNEVERS